MERLHGNVASRVCRICCSLQEVYLFTLYTLVLVLLTLLGAVEHEMHTCMTSLIVRSSSFPTGEEVDKHGTQEWLVVSILYIITHCDT